jgi:hypothetical protein
VDWHRILVYLGADFACLAYVGQVGNQAIAYIYGSLNFVAQ